MGFVISEGALRSLDRVTLPPAYSLRVTDDYTLAYAEIWRTQPAVRTVCSFLGRNIAELGIHVFRRLSDTDRERLTDHPLAQLLNNPAPWLTRYRMMNALVQDRAVYDTAYWVKLRVEGTKGVAGLSRLAPFRVEPKGDGGFFADEFLYQGDKGKRIFKREEIVHFHGYNPSDDVNGSSPIESLRRVLAEDYEASRMREQTLRNGARVSGYLRRPLEAPDWGTEARTRFKRGWRQQYAGNGPEAGGTPVLEDGMEFVPASWNSEELQYIQVRKLTREEVAAAYHIPPPMVGILDHATFGNIEEQHKMLYMDTLGPWLTDLKEEIELQLLSEFEDRAGVYTEFNLAAKLKGSFEEQAAALQTSVGAPWLTRNEARARQNLPQVEGGDDLITPLNVIINRATDDGMGELTGDDIKQRVDAAAALIRSGFDPAEALSAVGLDPIKHLGLLPVTVQKPVDPTGEVDEVLVEEISKARKSGPRFSRSSSSEPLHIKSGAREQDTAAAKAMLVRFFKRQRSAVLARLGSKAPSWWDEKRWNKELADDLYALSMMVTAEVAAETLDALGVSTDEYNAGQTEKFLRAVAESRAGAINSTTRDQIKHALDVEDDDDVATSSPAGVFDVAETSRSDQAAGTLSTTLAAFAVTEAAKQLGRPETTKTWVVTSSNPRPSHDGINGETVKIDEIFSNGMNGPGDPAGGADEVAGCSCVLDVTVP
jgi:HK97 family phage portal protein